MIHHLPSILFSETHISILKQEILPYQNLHIFQNEKIYPFH